MLDLERDRNGPTDVNEEQEAKLTIGKNRNGAAGEKIDLKFHGAFQRFRESGWQGAGR